VDSSGRPASLGMAAVLAAIVAEEVLGRSGLVRMAEGDSSLVAVVGFLLAVAALVVRIRPSGLT
jgi:hypothetical protein